MKKHGLLLERHTGRRRPREHDGQVATIRSNCRWCSDALEFTCWNGSRTRRLRPRLPRPRSHQLGGDNRRHLRRDDPRHDGALCRAAVRHIRAPQPVQWLSDNGSIFAAHRTIEIAVALNLVPCFTPVESPESNGMAEAFVKTFKRDYVRVSPIPTPRRALASIDTGWRTTTPFTRIPDWATAHPGNTSCSRPNPLRVRFNGVNSTNGKQCFRKSSNVALPRLEITTTKKVIIAATKNVSHVTKNVGKLMRPLISCAMPVIWGPGWSEGNGLDVA